MNAPTNIQIINGPNGKPAFVVIRKLPVMVP